MFFTPLNLPISLPNALPEDSESTFSVLLKSHICIHFQEMFFVPNPKLKYTSLLSFPSKVHCF